MIDHYDDGQDAHTKHTTKHSNIKKIPDQKTAVALQDRTAEGLAPTISAAGRGKIAETILQLAFENDIKVREDSDLAQMLATIEIDSPIPSEAFMAVAEVLSYVYKANGAPNPFDTKLLNDDETTEENINKT